MARPSFFNRLLHNIVYLKVHATILFSCSLLFLFYSPPAVSITIDITVEGSTKNGVTLIKIEDIPERKDGGVVVASSITVKKNLTSGDQETVASNGTSKDSFTFGGDPNSLDPKERERAEDLREASQDAASLEITIADEVFEGVKIGGTRQRAASKDQIIENSFQEQNFEELPFDSSATFIDIADNNLAVFAGIINTSTNFAFNFTALSLFTGLDHSFFTPTEFDSLEAIASGILTLDLISDVGVNSVAIPRAGGEANSVVYLSGEFIDPSGYFLVTGTARPIIADGTFGEEVNFSFGARRISEPTLLSLLIFGLAALVFYQRRGRMTLREISPGASTT